MTDQVVAKKEENSRWSQGIDFTDCRPSLRGREYSAMQSTHIKEDDQDAEGKT